MLGKQHPRLLNDPPVQEGVLQQEESVSRTKYCGDKATSRSRTAKVHLPVHFKLQFSRGYIATLNFQRLGYGKESSEHEQKISRYEFR